MVEHSLWERDAVGSNPITPIGKHAKITMIDEQMTEITEQEFQDQFDDIMKRIEEDKEYFLIRREDGSAIVAAPITEDLEPLLDIMPEVPYDGEVPGEPSF